MVPAWLGTAVLSCIYFCVGCSDIRNAIDSLPPLPQSISSLPVGIIVEPEESFAEAQLEDADIKNLSADPYPVYRWDHPITIQAQDGDIQLIEYGVFAWIDNQWYDATEEQKPYPAEELIEFFDCEDALLIAGQSYQSDRFSNWSNVPRDKPKIYRMYFIGEIDGKRVRGETTLVDMPPTK
jgi:hypothetical protein